MGFTDMPDLFLIRHPTDAVLLLRPAEDGTWDSCKRPPVERKKKSTLRYGPDGWVLNDTSGQPSAVLYRPAGGASQERNQPPLGPWRRVSAGKESGEECTLTDVEPTYVKFENTNMLQAPFADISIMDRGDVVRIEAALNRAPMTDSTFDALLKRFRELLLALVRRPRAILMLQLSLQDAAVPSMRHVKQFMSFVNENSWALGMLVRGCAVILKPQGYSSYALQNIVKMVLRVLPPPWQTRILPTVEEGRNFLDKVTIDEAQLLARRPLPSGTPKSVWTERGQACNEATPSTIEEDRSLLSIDDVPYIEVEEQQHVKQQSPTGLAAQLEEDEVGVTDIDSKASWCSEAHAVEIEPLESACNAEAQGCWGAGWFLACACSKP